MIIFLIAILFSSRNITKKVYKFLLFLIFLGMAMKLIIGILLK